MLQRKYAALLFDRGLTLLPIALYVTKPKEFKQLQELLKKITNIDISVPKDEFTDEEVEQLKEFEKTHNQILLGIIIGNDMEDPFHVQLLNREMELRERDQRQTAHNFNFTCWYGACLTLLGFMYLFMITWIPIPPENMRFADTGLGAIIGSVIQTITNHFFQLKEAQRKKADEQTSSAERFLQQEDRREECE